MRKIYFLAVAAAMFAACSSNDKLDTGQDPGQVPIEEGSVGFDAYINRPVTRAGAVGEMNLAALQTSGFGVFGYYTDNNDYDQQRIPDFMYNQKVEYIAGAWGYEPVKYWPNEYGASAISDDNDKLSFFAYAPYVEVVPSSGKLTAASEDAKWGIAGLSRNSASGDPLVKYIVSFDQDKSVDLMWGVCDDTAWSIVDTGSKQMINEGEKGKPWLNVCRPQTVDQRMRFTFKHALAQLSVNVDAFVDGYSNENALNPNSRIFIRQISFTGFALKGALNLNNSEQANKAYWLDYNGSADLESGESVIIYDGRKDGKEGASGSVASNEKTLGINPQFVQDAEWNSGDMTAGVTNVPASLFRNYDTVNDKYVAATAPLMVIPTGEDIEVEIVYDVETPDDNLATYVSDKKQFGSSIENRIRKPISFGGENFENGKHYTLNLHLGMNSVKFDAMVSDWEEVGVTPDIHLPSNMPTFAASSSATPADYTSDVSIDHSITEYVFAVSGLNGGESVANATTLAGATVAVNSKADFTGNANAADVSGVAYVKVTTITANDDVLNKVTSNAITITGNESGKKRVLNVTQMAHALGLSINALSADGKEFTLGTTATMSVPANWQVNSTSAAADDHSVTVLKNGTPLTKVDVAPSSAGEFQFDTANSKIILFTAAAPGDVYTITVKTGDAGEERKQVTIGGLLISASTATVNVGETVTLTATKIGTGTIAWSSDDTSQATVADGVVTGVAAGSPTITATLTPDDISGADGFLYLSATPTATCTVTIP